MSKISQKKRVLILGGGFGGIETALTLNAGDHDDIFDIELVSDKHHFEYTPSLYRVVTGKSPLEVCIPLSDIFEKTKVVFDVDTISKIDLKKNVVHGISGTKYNYDFLVVALGSEPSFFGIPGLDKFSMGFKSITQALALKNHLHKTFDEHSQLPKKKTLEALHIDIVGAGASGVELAGELSKYLETLADNHNLDKKSIKIDLIEAGPRVLPMMTDNVSERAKRKLEELGINVMLNTKVMSEDGEKITYSDGELKSKTLIWTAGVKPNHIFAETEGLEYGKGGRVVVDEFLRVKGFQNVFILGDGADTPFAGTAQTAIHDGEYTAHTIIRTIKFGKPHLPYVPAKTGYIIPVGPNWAIFTFKNFVFSGLLISWLKRLVELDFLMTFLPFGKAWRAWRDGIHLCESCPTCEAEIKKVSK